MSYELLKDNIESLIAQKKYRVSKVEELAGIKYGNLSSILSGRSKKPSAEILLSIAKVFGVTVDDLYKSKELTTPKPLSSKELSLLKDIVTYLHEQIVAKNIELYYKDFMSITNEIYEYSTNSEDYAIDKKFIDWYLKHKYKL